MTSKITDIWFRSKSSLAKIAQRLELLDSTEDAENYWQWVIGVFHEFKLDITRTHTRPRGQVDTRIFLLENEEFSEALLAEVVRRLRKFIPGPIACGRWEYRSGNDFDLVIVQEFRSSRAED